MTDPFTDLYAPVEAVEPDPDFARRLRMRLDRALALPRGVEPVTTQTETPTEPQAATAPRAAAVPYLAVTDARAAIDWYVDVFGAELVDDPIVMPDGRIGHSELEISGGVVYLSDAHPEIGVTAPRPGESTVSLMLPVHDADVVRDRALAAGASGDRPPYDGHGTRNAWIVDPFGHRWGINSPLRAAAPAIAYRHGDVVHVALTTPDVQRTRDFYVGLLGWAFLPDGRVDGAVPSVGFREGPAAMTVTYAVDDIDTALDRVRAAGGQPGGIERHSWGTVADCVDDQGTPLRLFEVPADPDGTPPPANGNRPGDVSYLTLETVDSNRARAFYGAVLGWTFRPGHVDDGWQVTGPVLMTGFSGGHERAAAVPMWSVGDIEEAVGRVRGNGGTATEPERQPYGVTSTCSDDQGLRFYLGDLS